MMYNAIQVLNTWVVQVFVVILQEYHIKQSIIYRLIKKSLCTWRLQYSTSRAQRLFDHPVDEYFVRIT